MKLHYTVSYMLFLMITFLHSKYMILKTKGKDKKQIPKVYDPKESLESEEQRHEHVAQVLNKFRLKWKKEKANLDDKEMEEIKQAGKDYLGLPNNFQFQPNPIFFECSLL